MTMGVVRIEHSKNGTDSVFRVVRFPEGESSTFVTVPSPYDVQVAGNPHSWLMPELRWYLELFLDYPCHPETVRAGHLLDALKSWGKTTFSVLVNSNQIRDLMSGATTVQVPSDDPNVLPWPWEALASENSGCLAHTKSLERRPRALGDPVAFPPWSASRINILLVIARPYRGDVRYRSVASSLLEVAATRGSSAQIDLLRPPTFSRLNEILSSHPGYYHVVHFDGHGTFTRASATV